VGRATVQRFGPQTSEALLDVARIGAGDRRLGLPGRSSGERRSRPGVGDLPSHSKENDHAALVTRATGERPGAEGHHDQRRLDARRAPAVGAWAVPPCSVSDRTSETPLDVARIGAEREKRLMPSFRLRPRRSSG
jgi:hypothetical protein